MTDLTKIVDNTIAREGRYSNNPADPGGETMWGITLRTARRHGYTGAMRDMPRATAAKIYVAEYLSGPGFDKLVPLSVQIAEEVFDTGVNMGVVTAGKMLQRALNLFNQGGRMYPDLEVDGVVGPATVSALKAYLSGRGSEAELVLLRALNCFQGEQYARICEARQASETFAYGWFLNRVVI